MGCNCFPPPRDIHHRPCVGTPSHDVPSASRGRGPDPRRMRAPRCGIDTVRLLHRIDRNLPYGDEHSKGRLLRRSGRSDSSQRNKSSNDPHGSFCVYAFLFERSRIPQAGATCKLRTDPGGLATASPWYVTPSNVARRSSAAV